MRKSHSLLTLLALLLSGVALTAEIRWDATRASPTFGNGKDQTTIVFVGRNTGNDTKTIESISSSCDCTTARAVRNTIAPGEVCEIQVAVSRSLKNPNPGSTLHVVMAKGEIHTLTVDRVSVDDVQPTPAFVWWGMGESPVAKEVIFEAGEDTLPITSVKPLKEDGNFACTLERIDAHRWRGQITPRKTEAAGVTEVQFAITRGTKTEVATVYARIADPRLRK